MDVLIAEGCCCCCEENSARAVHEVAGENNAGQCSVACSLCELQPFTQCCCSPFSWLEAFQ
jgi:hypothetical protein